jgi:hypothetical protein
VTTKELLFNEIEDVPEPVLAEILDFIQFLKHKIRPGLRRRKPARLCSPRTGSAQKRTRRGKVSERVSQKVCLRLRWRPGLKSWATDGGPLRDRSSRSPWVP